IDGPVLMLGKELQFEFVWAVIGPLVFDISAEMEGPATGGGEVEDVFDGEGGEVGFNARMFPLGDDGGTPPIGEAVAGLDFGLPIAVDGGAIQEAATHFELAETTGDGRGVDF